MADMQSREYIWPMTWEVEIAGEFKAWWQEQSQGIRYDVGAIVLLLEERGPQLSFQTWTAQAYDPLVTGPWR